MRLWQFFSILHSHSTEWLQASTNALTSGTRGGWPIMWQPQLNALCRTGWWVRRRRTWSPARLPACRLRWKGRRSTDTKSITAVAKPRARLRGPHSDGRAVHTHSQINTWTWRTLAHKTNPNSCGPTPRPPPQHSSTFTHGETGRKTEWVNERSARGAAARRRGPPQTVQ